MNCGDFTILKVLLLERAHCYLLNHVMSQHYLFSISRIYNDMDCLTAFIRNAEGKEAAGSFEKWKLHIEEVQEEQRRGFRSCSLFLLSSRREISG